MQETAVDKRKIGISTALSLVVATAALLPLLGHKPLADWDEAIYAEIARELLGHSKATLMWHFQPWFEKPPLYMWLTAVFFSVFHVNEFWARAVAAFSGIGLVGIVHGLLARRRGLAAAWTSTAILLTTLGFLRACHLGEVDTLLTLGCYLALWGIMRIRERTVGEGAEGAGWYLFWIGFAIAVMTKGAAAVVIPLSVLVLLVWERWPRRFFGRHFLLGALLFLALVLPWHLVMYREYGITFICEYLGEQTLARATTQLELHNNPPWFFIEVMLGFASPWVFVFPSAAWSSLRGDSSALAKPVSDEAKYYSDLRPFAVFALVVFTLFTISQTRLPRYIVPMYPAIALIAADGITCWISAASANKGRQRRWWTAGIAAAASFALAVALTRGLRERVTSQSTTSAVVHEDRGFLPLLRSEADLSVAPPVLLCQDGGWMQLPAALFYLRKPVQQVWINDPPDSSGRAPRYYHAQSLADFVVAEPHLLLIPKRLAAELPPGLKFVELHEAGDLEIGMIATR